MSKTETSPSKPESPFAGHRFHLHDKRSDTSLGPFTWQELIDLAHSGDLQLENRIADIETPGRWMKIADTPLVFELPLSYEDHRYEPVVKKPSRLSQRARDYLWLLFGGNLFILLMNFGIALNVISGMFILALMVIYNIALAWILFGIMKPY